MRNRGSAIFAYKRINKGVSKASGEFKCFGLIHIYPPITADRGDDDKAAISPEICQMVHIEMHTYFWSPIEIICIECLCHAEHFIRLLSYGSYSDRSLAMGTFDFSML